MAVLWQQFLAWYARIADCLNQDDHLAITLAGLALIRSTSPSGGGTNQEATGRWHQ
jgi:hypothetical protein